MAVGVEHETITGVPNLIAHVRNLPCAPGYRGLERRVREMTRLDVRSRDRGSVARDVLKILREELPDSVHPKPITKTALVYH